MYQIALAEKQLMYSAKRAGKIIEPQGTPRLVGYFWKNSCLEPLECWKIIEPQKTPALVGYFWKNSHLEPLEAVRSCNRKVFLYLSQK